MRDQLARKYKYLLWLFACTACVESINFDSPPPSSQIVVEGYISDSPGPYEVKLSQAIPLDSDSLTRVPMERARITLHSSDGLTENLMEEEAGVYKTGGVVQGKAGQSYFITIQTEDGRIFESTPERIRPVGRVEEIRYEFEARTTDEGFGDIPADVFNIFVDADAGPDQDVYTRWRFTGTYKLETSPELRLTEIPPYTPFKDPPECSGYIVVEFLPGGKLEKVGECTCCICWVNQFEDSPQLSDNQFIDGNQFSNVKVAEVPINRRTFFGKYMVTIEQMSLSREAFQFFKIIREQKESASSLFQPQVGEIGGNLKAINNNDIVIGMFWATSITKKSIFIPRSAVPYNLPPPLLLTDDCRGFYPFSSTDLPEGWE